MKSKFKSIMITFMAFLCLSVGSVSAATYSKTKTKNVSYSTNCTGKISDKATVNSVSLDWSFSLSGTTVTSNNGYTFGKPYSVSTTFTNARKTAAHKVGYYFYTGTGNSVGGNSTTITFYYNGSSAIN